MLRASFLFALLMTMTASYAEARPVSYPGGWTLMLMNDAQRHSLHYHYSPTAKTSIGYRLVRWRDFDTNLHAVQVNHLIKRWNKLDSQANLYLKGGLGITAGAPSDNNDIGGFIGLTTDWEDRRYFVSYSNLYTRLNDEVGFFQQSARVGWAPYEGDFGELHTWLMLQVDHLPENEDQLVATPLVRLFKDVHLAEFGVSSKGDVLFNYIYRF